MHEYTHCTVVQTVGHLEDEFDGEGLDIDMDETDGEDFDIEL